MGDEQHGPVEVGVCPANLRPELALEPVQVDGEDCDCWCQTAPLERLSKDERLAGLVMQAIERYGYPPADLEIVCPDCHEERCRCEAEALASGDEPQPGQLLSDQHAPAALPFVFLHEHAQGRGVTFWGPLAGGEQWARLDLFRDGQILLQEVWPTQIPAGVQPAPIERQGQALEAWRRAGTKRGSLRKPLQLLNAPDRLVQNGEE